MLKQRPYAGKTRQDVLFQMSQGQASLDSQDIRGRYSDCLMDITNKLIQLDPKIRLGSNGIEDIKRHTFFASIDWVQLAERKIDPGFSPKVRIYITISFPKNYYLIR